VIIAVRKLNLGFSIRFMCRVVGVSPSGYRNWRDSPSAVAVRHDDLAVDIEAAWRDSGCTYGARRVHAELVRNGKVRCCERTVREVMRSHGWSSVHPVPWRCTTQPDGTAPASDLIKRDFTAGRPGERLVGDITQIDTWEGPLFLATVIDLCTKEVVGWAIDDNHQAALVVAAIVMARQNRRIRRQAIFHSDRGAEYTSTEFKKCLRRARMRQSMGAVGTAYDNALAESFFASLKKECVHPTVFATHTQTRIVIEDYITRFYNTRRLHSALGYRPPAEARRSYTSKSNSTTNNQQAAS